MITALNQKLLKGIREEELSVFLEVAGKIRENIQNEKMEGGIL